MFRIVGLAVLLLAPIGSNALAQNSNGKNPSAAAAAKRQRCDDEGSKYGAQQSKKRKRWRTRSVCGGVHEAIGGD